MHADNLAELIDNVVLKSKELELIVAQLQLKKNEMVGALFQLQLESESNSVTSASAITLRLFQEIEVDKSQNKRVRDLLLGYKAII